MPVAAGGGLDLHARILADQLSAQLGQTVVVINRPGAALHPAFLYGVDWLIYARNLNSGNFVLASGNVQIRWRVQNQLLYVHTPQPAYNGVIMVNPSVPDKAPRRQKLSDRIVLSLRQEYLSGQIAAGQRLPTEIRLAETFEVSRTVVREAIAALVADGLVETRQGAGIFVLEPPAPPTLQSLGADVPGNIAHALNVLEVRMALEMESAALAAMRRNSSQEAEIQERFFEFERLLRLEQPTGKADFAFHRSIAEATNNPFYIEVLDALGAHTIPCDVTSPYATEEVLSHNYQAGLQKEHLAIMNAILGGDADQARNAMRAHLEASQQRYRSRLRERRARYESGDR